MLKIIRLELARNEGFPEGCAACGYEIRAPLNADGHIDANAWRTQKDDCVVRRFWEDEPDREGHLVHRRGGGWAFHYPDDPDTLVDESLLDEAGYRFDTHLFRPGEYVSIREPGNRMLTFKVVSVK